MSKCNHDRVLRINAHSSDLNFVTVPHLNLEKEGYLPHIDNVCGGDDVDIEICLDCGQVVGFEGLKDKEIKNIMKDEDADYDEGDDEVSELDGDPYGGRW